MNEFHVRIYHPDLDNLSDRTFRYLLKRASVLIREIQLQEVLAFIDEQPHLDQADRQSLRDTVIHQIESQEAYYVDRVERSSLTILVIGSAVGWFILKQTLGSTLKDAFKQTATHDALEKVLLMPLGRKKLAEVAKAEAENANFGRIQVETVETEEIKLADDSSILRMNLELSTRYEAGKPFHSVRVDERFVVNQARSVGPPKEQDPAE